MTSLGSYEQREDYAVTLFNRLPEADTMLVDAMKTLILLKVVDLYALWTQDGDVSSLAELFGCETCATPQLYAEHHLHSIGLDKVWCCDIDWGW